METENELWVNLLPYPEKPSDLKDFHDMREVFLDSFLMAALYDAEITIY